LEASQAGTVFFRKRQVSTLTFSYIGDQSRRSGTKIRVSLVVLSKLK
jgi:hypothetical protein